MKRRRRLAWMLGTLAMALAADAIAESDPLDLVQRAYDRTLRAPGVRSLELAVHRGGRLVARRAFDVAYRRDADGARSLVRFTAPSHLCGDALLVVETGGGPSDVWLYHAEERRPRRIGSTRNADAFYGTDLSFEELEHGRFEAWRLRLVPGADAGCACDVVEAWPPRDSQYERLLLWIDRAREAVARIDFFRGAEGTPAKRLTVALDGAVEEAGYLRIPRMRIEQVGNQAWTDVETVRMEIDPAIPAALFSAAVLERESDDLYDLAQRHAALGVAP